MKFYGKAERAAEAIIEAFESQRIPTAVATTFLKTGRHSDSWSFMNQFLVTIAGYTDARTYKQWQAVDRQVSKGQKAFQILAPCMTKVTKVDPDTGEEHDALRPYGYKGISVFGYEQTEGEAIDFGEAHIDGLPLVEVAHAWGLKIETFTGRKDAARGLYHFGTKITIGVEELATWAHELVHAADDRAGTMKRCSSKADEEYALAEVVAELGGAALLMIIGEETAADLGGAYEYIKGWSRGRTPEEVANECRKVICRVGGAVALILEEAAKLGIASEVAA